MQEDQSMQMTDPQQDEGMSEQPAPPAPNPSQCYAHSMEGVPPMMNPMQMPPGMNFAEMQQAGMMQMPFLAIPAMKPPQNGVVPEKKRGRGRPRKVPVEQTQTKSSRILPSSTAVDQRMAAKDKQPPMMIMGGYPGMNPMMNPYFAMMGMGMRPIPLPPTEGEDGEKKEGEEGEKVEGEIGEKKEGEEVDDGDPEAKRMKMEGEEGKDGDPNNPLSAMAAMKMFSGMPPMPPMMMPGMMPPPGSVDKASFDQLKTSMEEMAADINAKYDSVLEYLQKLEERMDRAAGIQPSDKKEGDEKEGDEIKHDVEKVEQQL